MKDNCILPSPSLSFANQQTSSTQNNPTNTLPSPHINQFNSQLSEILFYFYAPHSIKLSHPLIVCDIQLFFR